MMMMMMTTLIRIIAVMVVVEAIVAQTATLTLIPLRPAEALDLAAQISVFFGIACSEHLVFGFLMSF